MQRRDVPVTNVFAQLVGHARTQAGVSAEARRQVKVATRPEEQQRLAAEAIQASMNATEAVCKIIELLSVILEGAIAGTVSVEVSDDEVVPSAN